MGMLYYVGNLSINLKLFSNKKSLPKYLEKQVFRVLSNFYLTHTSRKICLKVTHSGYLCVGGLGSFYLLLFTYLYFLFFYNEYALLL